MLFINILRVAAVLYQLARDWYHALEAFDGAQMLTRILPDPPRNAHRTF